PPPRFRTKTPAAFQPPSGRTRHEIMAAFRAYQVQYVDRLRQANGLDLARARTRSPVASWLVFPLGCGFAAMAAHDTRHLVQGRAAARDRARSPGASWLGVPLGCGFAAMAAHERRHLWQARQVTQAPGFPQ